MFPIKRRFKPDDPFFYDGNLVSSKIKTLVDEDIDLIIDSFDSVNIDEFKCTVKGCLKTFTCPLEFNRHFNLLHMFICNTCKKYFPSNFLLDLHLQETHDSYFIACCEKGLAVYSCLLESCCEKFINDSSRKKHLVKKHGYPADFRFNSNKREHKKYQKKVKDTVDKPSMKLDGSNFTKMCTEPHEAIKNDDTKYKRKKNRNKFIMEIDAHSVDSTLLSESEVCGSIKECNKTKEKVSTKTCDEKTKHRTNESLKIRMDHQSYKHDHSPSNNGETNKHNKNASETSSSNIPKNLCFGRGTQRGFSRRK